MPAVIYDPAYRTYDFGEEHPFSPLRVDMVLDLLHELGHDIPLLRPAPATREEILTIHDEGYVRCLEALSAGGQADGGPFGLGTPDNPVFPEMEKAARHLVGGTLAAARLLTEGGESRVLQLGGGLHHARRARASGFCVYNDLAVAIRHMTRSGLYVAYLDIDVHHGDGVQDIFNEDDHVLTVSLHESGQYLFPGTGAIHELGGGMGRGLKVNLPMEPFTEDESYLDTFERVVPEALGWFGPGALVVQAGADAHFEDPLADLLLTTRAYERLFRRILELADQHCQGRLLVTLGGGYSVRATPRIWTLLTLIMHGLPLPDALPKAWLERWEGRMRESLPKTLHDSLSCYDPIARRDEIARHNRQTAQRLLDATSRYWV